MLGFGRLRLYLSLSDEHCTPAAGHDAMTQMMKCAAIVAPAVLGYMTTQSKPAVSATQYGKSLLPSLQHTRIDEIRRRPIIGSTMITRKMLSLLLF